LLTATSQLSKDVAVVVTEVVVQLALLGREELGEGIALNAATLQATAIERNFIKQFSRGGNSGTFCAALRRRVRITATTCNRYSPRRL